MIQFLKNWWKVLISSPPDDINVEVVASDESIARFIYQNSDWSKKTNTPKPKVFLPMEHKGKWETSVCRISNISEQRIWEIAHNARYPKPALARADLIVKDIPKNKLYVVPAPIQENNYLEHAVIMGWPEEKENRIALAQELVASANLKIASTQI